MTLINKSLKAYNLSTFNKYVCKLHTYQKHYHSFCWRSWVQYQVLEHKDFQSFIQNINIMQLHLLLKPCLLAAAWTKIYNYIIFLFLNFKNKNTLHTQTPKRKFKKKTNKDFFIMKTNAVEGPFWSHRWSKNTKLKKYLIQIEDIICLAMWIKFLNEIKFLEIAYATLDRLLTNIFCANHGKKIVYHINISYIYSNILQNVTIC